MVALILSLKKDIFSSVNFTRIHLMSSKSNNGTLTSSNIAATRKAAKTGIRASSISLHSRSSSTSSLAKIPGSTLKASASVLASSPPSNLPTIRDSQDENVSSKKSRTGPGPTRPSSHLTSANTATVSHAKHSSMSSAATAYWVANHSRPQSPSSSWDMHKQSSSLAQPIASNGRGFAYSHAEADQRERDALFNVSSNNIVDENLSSSSIATVVQRSGSPSVAAENFFSGRVLADTIKARPSSTKKRKAVNMPLPIPFPSLEGPSSGTTVKTSEVTVQASSASATSSSTKALSAATTRAIMKDSSTLTSVAQADTPSPASMPSIQKKYIPPLVFDKGEDVFAGPSGVTQGSAVDSGANKHGRTVPLPSEVEESPANSLRRDISIDSETSSKGTHLPESQVTAVSQRGFSLKIRPCERHVEFWDLSDKYVSNLFPKIPTEILIISLAAKYSCGMGLCFSSLLRRLHLRRLPRRP